jgi:hypothetical protein
LVSGIYTIYLTEKSHYIISTHNSTGLKFMSAKQDKAIQKQTHKNAYNAKQTTQTGHTQEIGGPKGPEPTRYGDWEKNGRCSDF